MEVFCTSVIPIKLCNAEVTKEVLQICKERQILLDYTSYTGEFDLRANPDINTSFLKLYHIPSSQTDIQCAFCETTLTIVLTWKNTYEDYYQLVNSLLQGRKQVVKRVVEYSPKDASLVPLLDLLKQYMSRGVAINYAFTFYSVYDYAYNSANEQHLKVLVEPSIINMDDMLSSADTYVEYTAKTEVNKKLLNSIQNIDMSNEQETYITWASIVSLSRNREMCIRNHIMLTQIEILIQRIWNMCYTKNNELNDLITNIKSQTIDIHTVIVDTYQILIESKNCISATYSSRISNLYKAIVESSQLKNNTQDLEQKLNYLIVFANSINQNKNRRIQESSEIMLFMIAIAQVVPLFFDLPLLSHYWLSSTIVLLICVIGIWLIRNKYK